MILFLKILFLLWLVNFAPPFLAYLLEDRCNRALDGGVLFRDGKPLLGKHKTVRGLLAGILVGTGAGLLLGFTWWEGLLAGLLSLSGDLLSSFIKRRAGYVSGSVVPGLDQIFEGLFPLLFLAARYPLGWGSVLLLVILFSVPAYFGSWFFKKVLSQPPYEGYPRKVSPRVRLRELRACDLSSGPLYPLLNFEHALYYHIFMKMVFRTMGVYSRGVRNALQVRLERRVVHFPDLPAEFDDYSILFLSDLHLDGVDQLTETLQGIVDPISIDLCLLGGDYRMRMYGPCNEALRRMERLTDRIHARDGIYSILGNHDCVEMIHPLENRGVRFLINGSEVLERKGSRIWLVGIDDPHYYRCHDLEKAFSDVPGGGFSICMAHSPEAYREAAAFGARFYLCGHTHGGQIGIPRLGPVFTHSRAPRRVSSGLWQEGKMIGLTSVGAGVSGVPVRFFTRGEVLLLTLKRGPKEA